MADAPSFLTGVTDEPTQNINSSLQDENQETPQPNQSGTPNGEEGKGLDSNNGAKDNASETPKIEDKKEEASQGASTEEPTYDAVEILKKKPEERTEEEKKALEEGKDILTEDQKKQLDDEAKAQQPQQQGKETTKPKILGKFNSVEELQKAYQDLEKTVTNAQQKTQQQDTPQDKSKKGNQLSNIEALKSTPLIDFKLPNPEHYYIKEGNNQTFDINGYMKDFTRNLILGVQASMLGGPLAAAQFGLLQEALKEEHQKTIQEAGRQEFAQNTYSSLVKKFPVLGTDGKLQKRFERAIWGEKIRRYNESQANKTEFKDLELQDYEDLLVDLIGNTQPPTQQTQVEDPTEKPKGGPTIGGFRQPVDEVDDAIEGMMRVKKSSIF